MYRYVFYVLLGLEFILASFALQVEDDERVHSCPQNALKIHPCYCKNTTDNAVSIQCENTNLASLSLALGSLAADSIPIKELLINDSNFRVLFGSLFSNVQAQKIIIANTPIESLDEFIFNGVNETLSELKLYNTSLENFPKSFKVLGKINKLEISTHNIKKLESTMFFDDRINQKLEHLFIANGNITEIGNEFFQMLRKLKTLDLHGNQLKQLKKNQFKNLRDLEILDISFNAITKIDSSHIADLTKLGWLNISHNAITEIERGTFARNSVLRLLNMSHNKLKRLDSNSFRGMRFLRRLFLSDNMINDVGRGTFSAITRVGTIDMARNQLKRVDFQMFAQLNYIENIDLAENNITEVQKQAFKDLYLTHINMSHNIIQSFESNSFENCVNMTVLDLSHNSIRSISKNVFDELSYATELLLNNNLLTNMSAIPLGNMTGIKILNVSHNEIVEIPKGTFPKLYELHTIDLSHNNLTTIFNGVFQTLFSLRNLNMSFNHLVEIKNGLFGTIPTILELDLNNNRLQKVAKGALTKLNSLRSLTLANNELTRIFEIPTPLNSLNLRNNRIEEILPNTWPTMNALIELDLSDNLLADRLTEESLKNLLTLRYIHLNNNKISSPPRESLRFLSTLQYLILQNNEMTNIPANAFGKLPVVFVLNLRNNKIETISDGAFDGLLQLIELDISHNTIRAIPPKAFFGLVSLRNLDLSFNELKRIDNKTNSAIEHCLSLEKINLSHNKISSITRKTFPSDPYIPYRLKDIDLSNNEISVLSYDLAFGTHATKILNLSYNSINEIRQNVLLNLTQLEVFDISNNELGAYEYGRLNFSFPGNLTSLFISHNRLQHLPLKLFKNPVALQSIDLSNNLIETFDFNLLKRVKNGLKLNIADNPLRCDCNVRPLSHFYQSFSEVPRNFSNIICYSPKILANKPLYDVTDENLNCNDSTEEMNDGRSILPDLTIQEIFYSKGNLSIRWTINQINKDVSGFYVTVRNSMRQITVEHHVSYEYRSDNIPGDELCEENCDSLEICVLSKDSNGSINGWFDTQCSYLPNLGYAKRRYTSDSEQIFKIYSLRKQIRVKSDLVSNFAASSAQHMQLWLYGTLALWFLVIQ